MAQTQIFSQVARALRIARFCHLKNASTQQGIERVAELEHARHYRLSRRQFVMGAGATMTGLALGTLPLVRHVQAKRISGARIAIVGGGLAGLACAYELQCRGVLATVYEGNPNRIGGRCHSDRVTFPGQVAELGGEMIDNLGKTMLGYAREFKLAREDDNKELGDSSFFFLNQRYSAREWLPQPYPRGSYPCYRPGQCTSIAGLEGQSAGLLKFAGEHADSFYEWQGFMEGTALSGLAAAGEILDDMAAGRL